MNVHFINSSHKIGNKERRAGTGCTEKIIVGDGCWIGADCTIMSGVTIEEGTIIGVGFLVLEDCISNAVYAGRPAKLSRKLEE